MSRPGLARRFAGACASSVLFRRGRVLWEKNSRDWNLPMSKWDKLLCGGYIVLRDYADGSFPPQFEDQAAAYRNEIEYHASIPGMELEQLQRSQMVKPFWDSASSTKFLGDFNRVFALLERHGVKAPQRLLELGCGSGWMAELLAHAGYHVIGTTISKYDVEIANQKAEALRTKNPKAELRFVECPMESVNEIPEARSPFDAAYVYEALHHAFDWPAALRATAASLKSGGWILLASEPNRLHTAIAYRVAKLSRTHEIGFAKRELVAELNRCGFTRVEVLQPRIDNWKTPFWIMAQKD